ncbi:MAG: hypothetical protein IKF97_04345 [Clostridia bacterium]|nr:hypothetical protein [Clostridia bacterium]
MSKNQKILKVISYLYIIAAVIVIAVGIFAFTPAGKEAFKDFKIQDEQKLQEANIEKSTMVGINFIASSLSCLIVAVLLKRAIKDGSKTTMLLILLLLNIAGSVTTIVRGIKDGFSQEILSACGSLVVDSFILYNVYKVRKAADED